MKTIKQRAKKHLAETMAAIVKRATMGRNITFQDIATPSIKGHEITTIRRAIIHAAASSGITAYDIARVLNLGYCNCASILVHKADKMYQTCADFRKIADRAYNNQQK